MLHCESPESREWKSEDEYWVCSGAARKGEEGRREKESPRPIPRTAEVRERRPRVEAILGGQLGDFLENLTEDDREHEGGDDE